MVKKEHLQPLDVPQASGSIEVRLAFADSGVLIRMLVDPRNHVKEYQQSRELSCMMSGFLINKDLSS